MSISIISTVFNEVDKIEAFIESLVRFGVEVVIVDGGSTDGTIEKLKKYPIKLIIDESCNLKNSPSPVARGRNIAIQEASGDIIAVTDICEVDKNWLPEITKLGDYDVMGGRTITNKLFQNRDPLNPSSRNIAFKKSAWRGVGGYPEICLTAEDTLFNDRLKWNDYKFGYNPNAIVYWTPKKIYRTFYRYSKGDAISSTNTVFHMKIFLKLYALGFIFWFSWIAGLVVLALYCSVFGFRRFIINIVRLFGYFVGFFKSLFGLKW